MIASLFLAALVGLLPPGNVTAIDNPNDEGQAFSVTWAAPASPDTGFRVIGTEPAARTEYMDNDVRNGTRYYYAIENYSDTDSARSAVAASSRGISLSTARMPAAAWPRSGPVRRR